MVNQTATKKEIEDLSEELSLKLAARLKRGELRAEEMAEKIQLFLIAVSERKSVDELKRFIV